MKNAGLPRERWGLERVLHGGLAVVTVSFVLVGCTQPLTIAPGFDLYETTTAEAKNGQVAIEVSLIEIEPGDIAADFFGPGSDPFEGQVALQGVPLGEIPECSEDAGNTSLVIDRLEVASLPQLESIAVIYFEVPYLSLVSTEPITVTYGGVAPEQWNLNVDLTPASFSTGTMTLLRTARHSGTFDAQAEITPQLTFTRVTDSATRTLTLDDVLETEDVSWMVHVSDWSWPQQCTSEFVPGLSRLPVMGTLFREQVPWQGQQLILLVTPSLIPPDE